MKQKRLNVLTEESYEVRFREHKIGLLVIFRRPRLDYKRLWHPHSFVPATQLDDEPISC